MKYLLLTFILFTTSLANAELVVGPNGVVYGNICQTQTGWERINWQPVGSVCFAPQSRQWGYILNR